MKKSTMLTSVFLLLPFFLFSQKKNKKFYTDGYVLRLSDTISCKIFTAFKEDEIGYEVTFHYGDEKPITYHPGSVIEGFGIRKGADTTHYFQIPVPEYLINEQTNNKAYAEIISQGQLTLYKFSRIKNSALLPILVGPFIGALLSNKELNNYFLKISGEDSLHIIGHKNIVGAVYFERQEILNFVKERPHVLANTPINEFIYLKELRSILNSYNLWYQQKSKPN